MKHAHSIGGQGITLERGVSVEDPAKARASLSGQSKASQELAIKLGSHTSWKKVAVRGMIGWGIMPPPVDTRKLGRQTSMEPAKMQ